MLSAHLRPAAPLLLLVLLLPVLVGGCTLGRGASERAQALADEVLPGQLTVIGQRSQPGTIGLPVTEVQLRIDDDADAVVRLPQGGDAEALVAAVELAREQAGTFRDLRAALEANDLSVGAVGLSSTPSAGLQTVFVPEVPAGRNAAAVVARLDAALAETQTRTAGGVSSTVVLSDPGALRDLPEQDVALPTLLRLSLPEHVRAYESAGRLRAAVGPAGADDRPTTLWASLMPVLPRADQDALATAVESAGADWLATESPDLVTGRTWWAYARLERGRLDRLRVYVPACPAATVGCVPAGAGVLVAVTTDLAGDRIDEVTALPSPRPGGGGWSPPLERARLR